MLFILDGALRGAICVQINIFARKIAIMFLSFHLNIDFGCSKEPSHGDSSFECPRYMFLYEAVI